MYVVVIEKGEAFSVSYTDMFQFLERKVAGELPSVSEYGVGLGVALTDVTEFTPIEAILALRQLEDELGVGVANVA